MSYDDTESLHSDEGVITSCKRVKSILPDRKRPQNHGIELGEPPMFSRQKTTDRQESSNEGSGNPGVLKAASNWLRDHLSPPVNDIPVYGYEHSSPHSKQGLADPVSTSTTNDAIPISLPSKTMGKPSVGEFKPHRFASDKRASQKPPVPRSKAFDLSQNLPPQFIALVTPDEKLRSAKRQKIGPDKSITTDLTVDDIDLYDIRRNKNPRSSEDSVTATKSAQSLGSRPQQAVLTTLKGVPEYNQLQKLVGFPSNMETKKQNRIAKQSSALVKNGLQQKSSMFSEKIEALLIDEDDNLRAQPPTTKYIGNANLDPQIARSRYHQKNGMELKDSSGYFTSNGPNDYTRNSSRRLIRNSLKTLQPADKGSMEIGDDDDDEDSMDQLAEGHDTVRDEKLVLQRRDNPNGGQTTSGFSASVVSGGNIPLSASSKVQANTRRKGSVFQEIKYNYRLAYIQSELWTWPLAGMRGDQEVWELRLNPITNVFEPFNDDHLFKDLPGLYINPQQVNRIQWAEESGMVAINRSCGAGVSPMLLLEIIPPSSEHFVEALQRINNRIKCSSIPKLQLDKIFSRRKKLNQQRADLLDKAGRQSYEIELLESNQVRRNNEQLQIKQNRRTSIQDLDGLDNVNKQQTLAQSMRLDPQASSKNLQVVHNLDLTPNEMDEIHGFVEGKKPETRSAARNSAGQQKYRRSPSPPRWTELNPDWKNERAWVSSLVYPSEAKKRTTVDQDDIRRLDEGEFLNDNLIEFYLRYLEHNLEKTNPETAKRIYFQNTFFYEALTKGKVRSNNINYDAVKRWTAKVDLFEYDYIVVPVNEKMHWYLAIICNAPNLIRPAVKGIANSQGFHDADTQVDDEPIKTEPYQQEEQDASDLVQMGPLKKTASSDSVSQKVENMSLEDKSDTVSEWPSPDQSFKLVAFNKKIDDGGLEIVETDVTTMTPQSQSSKGALRGRKLKRKSMGRKYDIDETRIITMDSLGLSHSPACSNLREYLICEAKERHGMDISVTKLGMTAKNIPQQTNYCDCGLFVLGYIQKFLEKPDEFTRLILRGEMDVNTHWVGMKASRMREAIRELLFHLQNEQIQRQQEEHKAKKIFKSARKQKNLDLSIKSDHTASSHSSSTATSPAQLTKAVAQSNISESMGQATDQLETSVVKKSSGSADHHLSALAARSGPDKRSRESTPHKVDDVVGASVSPKRSSLNARHQKILLESPLDPDKLPKKKAASPPCTSQLGLQTQANNIFKKFRIVSPDDESPVSSPPRDTGTCRSYPVEIDDSFEGVVEESFHDLLGDNPQSLFGPRHSISPQSKTSTASRPMRTRSSPRTNQHVSFADGIYMTEYKRRGLEKPEVKSNKKT